VTCSIVTSSHRPGRGDHLSATSLADPRWRSPLRRGLLPVFTGSSGLTDDLQHGHPIPAPPTRCHRPWSFAYISNPGFRLAYYGPTIGLCARPRCPTLFADDRRRSRVKPSNPDALGVALGNRQTAAELTSGQKLLAKSATGSLRQGHNLGELRSHVYLARESGYAGIAMTPYRDARPPSTICSARDSCWRGGLKRRGLLWAHCCGWRTLTWRSRGRDRAFAARRRRHFYLCA